MNQDELHELTRLLAEDSFARDFALGVSPEQIAALNRLRGMDPWGDARYSKNDIGNGYLFADFYRDEARFVSERKCWYIYDGTVWRVDLGGLMAMEKCKQLAVMLDLLAGQIADPTQRDACLKRARRWENRHAREQILKDASGVHRLTMADFDRDPWLFNCENGTLDLRGGGFRAHRAEDLLTMKSGARYDPEARCERWERFITEIMGTPPTGDWERDAEAGADAWEKGIYLQKALGYALTGDNRHECLFILHGATTRNGKSTAMETFLRLMGDYGRTARPETIGSGAQVSGSGPSEDLARLNGARFVNISEPDKRLTLSASLVKTLTGSDTVTARFLHENSFEFRPQFKMFINTNYLPQITDMTLFSSGRVKLIPFERRFEPHEQDRGLKALFARPESLSGILNWCVEGLRMVEKEGLDEPEVVRRATASYRRSSDKMAQFVEDCLVAGADREARTGALYERYQLWCQSNGYRAENQRNFKQMLTPYGELVKKRPRGGGSVSSMLTGYGLPTGT